MPEAGQEIEGFGGMSLMFVRTGEETDGELLEMEASYSGEAGMPPEHLHPKQAERFEVVFVPLNDAAIFHRGVFDRHQTQQLGARNHKTADMLRQMPRKTDQLFHESAQLANGL